MRTLGSVYSSWAALLIVVSGAGCATTPREEIISIQKAGATTNTLVRMQRGGVFRHQPRHRPTAREQWNPAWWFGNVDEPVPPPDYRADDPRRVARYHRRNSCHNFTFYVCGLADQEFTRVGLYPTQVFNPHGGWNWAVARYKWIYLPFVSYQRGGFKVYCGWRERGNFGLKLNF
jgi:hypothetical protein